MNGKLTEETLTNTTSPRKEGCYYWGHHMDVPDTIEGHFISMAFFLKPQPDGEKAPLGDTP